MIPGIKCTSFATFANNFHIQGRMRKQGLPPTDNIHNVRRNIIRRQTRRNSNNQEPNNDNTDTSQRTTEQAANPTVPPTNGDEGLNSLTSVQHPVESQNSDSTRIDNPIQRQNEVRRSLRELLTEVVQITNEVTAEIENVTGERWDRSTRLSRHSSYNTDDGSVTHDEDETP
jgi:hypothetical protein